MRNCFGQYPEECHEKAICPTFDECRYCADILSDRAKVVSECEYLKRKNEEIRRSMTRYYIRQFGDMNERATI